jgi:hypothetical protein
VLGNDLTDTATVEAVWPIISNREALAINEAWAGDAGTLLKQSKETVHLLNCSWFNNDGCDHPAWMVWKKALPKGEVALLLMNNAAARADVSVSWAELPSGTLRCPIEGCTVRDVHRHAEVGRYAEGYTAKGLASHDGADLRHVGLGSLRESAIKGNNVSWPGYYSFILGWYSKKSNALPNSLLSSLPLVTAFIASCTSI